MAGWGAYQKSGLPTREVRIRAVWRWCLRIAWRDHGVLGVEHAEGLVGVVSPWRSDSYQCCVVGVQWVARKLPGVDLLIGVLRIGGR